MKKLRSGYTTGACAAAAAKAATVMLVSGETQSQVEIPFPDGSRVTFAILSCCWSDTDHTSVRAAVIKDAGDDPDVTNGAEIAADVYFILEKSGFVPETPIIIAAGTGVGTVTRPGLAVEVGQPAINPVPRRMITEAVTEAINHVRPAIQRQIRVTLSITNGEELAKKTLNHRLGIVGGLSILGTTGIVRPISAEAWTATIATSMNVARAAGLQEILLSTGRTSEAAVQRHLALPDTACAMMGDYLEFSLLEARKQGFTTIHLAAMWAKVLKGAMRIPQTHVRHGALEVKSAIGFLQGLGVTDPLLHQISDANTAREIYERLHACKAFEVIKAVCGAARSYCEDVSGLPVFLYLVTSDHGRSTIAHISSARELNWVPGRLHKGNHHA